MHRETFDWALVRSFLVVLDAGSLMGAVQRSGARQPTSSQHVAELEAQLGAPLFERTDDQVAYGRLLPAGAGIGFVARYNLAHWRDVVPVLPALKMAPMSCWLAVHRETRGNPVVRRVYDFLAAAIPAKLQPAQAVIGPAS